METGLRHFARLEGDYSFNCIFYLNKRHVSFFTPGKFKCTKSGRIH